MNGRARLAEPKPLSLSHRATGVTCNCFRNLRGWTKSGFARDATINKLSGKGKDFTEKDKASLKQKQLEFLKLVLPIYREAAERGQIELSTTPFYHPILPLVCDSDIARVANPSTPLPRRAYRHPEDAREQLRRAREYHQRVFGVQPAGLWPSEGSVSDQALAIAAEEGFKWFGTDEGVLGRTLNLGFFRDGTGLAANAERLYRPWRLKTSPSGITGLFRDHHISESDRICVQPNGCQSRCRRSSRTIARDW